MSTTETFHQWSELPGELKTRIIELAAIDDPEPLYNYEDQPDSIQFRTVPKSKLTNLDILSQTKTEIRNILFGLASSSRNRDIRWELHTSLTRPSTTENITQSVSGRVISDIADSPFGWIKPLVEGTIPSVPSWFRDSLYNETTHLGFAPLVGHDSEIESCAQGFSEDRIDAQMTLLFELLRLRSDLTILPNLRYAYINPFMTECDSINQPCANCSTRAAEITAKMALELFTALASALNLKRVVINEPRYHHDSHITRLPMRSLPEYLSLQSQTVRVIQFSNGSSSQGETTTVQSEQAASHQQPSRQSQVNVLLEPHLPCFGGQALVACQLAYTSFTECPDTRVTVDAFLHLPEQSNWDQDMKQKKINAYNFWTDAEFWDQDGVKQPTADGSLARFMRIPWVDRRD